ncbi:unnamed protein product [Owenia fusiformis]|uniref:GDP-D-glucose phosphorylase 1 n=1 Tax=Owenia fusiformis TaxID=6347 RepID=A0A8S4PDR3_OWEFU|nr:unnamed protein product [Owenia fusiformis]
MTEEEEVNQFQYSNEDFNQSIPSWDVENAECSQFDTVLRNGWDKAMKDGRFRYNLDHVKSKVLPGEKKLLVQLNTKRATERRRPQAIMGLKQEFNPDNFNFNKAKKGEILMELICKNSNSEGSPCKKQKKGRNLILINVSPLEYGNVLLVPDMEACQPQIMTVKGMEMALEVMLLSAHRGFRMGFNSLCGFASVNHLHFHAWYADHKLYTETEKVSHVHGLCYELEGSWTRGFVFQLEGSTINEVARSVHALTSCFQDNDTAHNLFMTRGQSFQDASKCTVRTYLWPRRNVFGIKDGAAFNVAVAELGGHLPLKDETNFETLTEELAQQTFSDASLDESDYSKIRTKVIEQLKTLDNE